MYREISTYKRIIAVVVFITAMFVGCGQEETRINPPGNGYPFGPGSVFNPNPGPGMGGGPQPTPTPAPGPNGGCGSNTVPDPYSFGDSSVLVPASATAFAQFAQARPYFGRPNCPGPILANLSFKPYGSSPQVFLGFFTMKYFDAPNGYTQLREGYLENGYPNYNTGKGNNIHTYMTVNGTQYIRIMIQDRFGALTLVMQQESSSGDSGNRKWKADVYFYNFPNPTAPNPKYDSVCVPDYYLGYCQVVAPNPQNYCWGSLVSDGPYRCKNLDIPPGNSGKYPFQLLGTIRNINLNKALGI